MSLKSLMQNLKNRAAVTPVTPEKTTGLQPKPAWIGACTLVTPVTPHLNDADRNMKIGQFGEAVNNPAPEPPSDPSAWRELAQAYHNHHFKCKDCIAAGRGAVYGLRCGVGASLWGSYQSSNLIQQKRNTR